MRIFPGRRRIGALAVLIVAGLAFDAGPAHAVAQNRGPVAVLYAGSLTALMQNGIGPAFARATGDSVSGIAAGSQELASEIRGGIQRADVFISASPSVDARLEGARNGNFVSWYATFARSALLLAYNPKSRFAAALRTRPWWSVVTEKGFRLGRTDPAVDPKGVLADEALVAASRAHHSRALAALARDPANEFPEQSLVGRLQAGQLDAGFFYAVEAAAADLSTVALGGRALGARFTVTVLRNAPDPARAKAFVAFLLSPTGRRLLGRNGLSVLRPIPVSGRRGAVPAGLVALFARA